MLLFFDDDFETHAVKEADRLLYSGVNASIEDVHELMDERAVSSISSEPERLPGAPAGVIPGAETIGLWNHANRVQVDPYIESPILTRFWEQRDLPVEWDYATGRPAAPVLPRRSTSGKEAVTPANVAAAPDPPPAKRLLAIPPVPLTPGALKLRIAAATGLTPNAVKWIALAGLLALIPLVVRK